MKFEERLEPDRQANQMLSAQYSFSRSTDQVRRGWLQHLERRRHCIRNQVSVWGRGGRGGGSRARVLGDKQKKFGCEVVFDPPDVLSSIFAGRERQLSVLKCEAGWAETRPSRERSQGRRPSSGLWRQSPWRCSSSPHTSLW
jgi:hypothetical protein